MKIRSGLKLLENGKYHAVRYIYDQGIYRDGKHYIKSGIASNDTPRSYTSATVRTEGLGKKWVWWDDNFIHQDLSVEQAGEIIKRMDAVFNQYMANEGFNVRKNNGNTRSIGTEYFEHTDKNELIEIIKETWSESYRIAYESVMKVELGESLWIEEFKPRPGQDTYIIDPLVNHYVDNDKATAQAHGGSGKTKTSFAVSQIVCEKILNKPWKVLAFADNQANTIQLAKEHALFYKGQKGKRLTETIIVGSINQMNKDVLESWATVIPASQHNELTRVLQEFVNSDRDCAVFVVNASAQRFLQITDKANLNYNYWFTIKDEIQQYASENGTPKRVSSPECAVINPEYSHLFGKKLGLSATHICRDIERHGDDMSIVFNDDVDKFGERVVDIDEIKARELGWICEKEGLIIPLPSVPEFVQGVNEKRPFELELNEQTVRIHPVEYVGMTAVANYIIPRGRTHILMLVSFRKDIVNTDGTGLGMAQVFRLMQESGMLDPEYEIIEGFCEKGRAAVNQFNKAKKAIIIATRWIGVGQDTYKCDCTLPLYNPSSRSFSRQFSMRGDRRYEDKVSTLAVVELEDRLEDSIWFESMQNIANGEIPRIVSDAEFAEENQTAIGSTRNPNGGNRVGNVTVVTNSNNDPILLGKWQELANMIGTRTYTDENGNSRFSEIANQFKNKFRAELYINKKIELVEGYLSGNVSVLHDSRKWQTNEFYINEFANNYNLTLEESEKLLKEPIKKIEFKRKKMLLDFTM